VPKEKKKRNQQETKIKRKEKEKKTYALRKLRAQVTTITYIIVCNISRDFRWRDAPRIIKLFLTVI
jgi:hypothetical protein